MKTDDYQGGRVLTVEGNLCGTEAHAVSHAFDTQESSGKDQKECRNWIIDLHRCRGMSSEGIEALLRALRQCESRGTALKLSGLDANCRTILHITRLQHQFECHTDLASAVKSLS